MGRYDTQEIQEYEIEQKHVLNEPTKYDDSERVLIIDADSLIYTSTYNPDRKKEQSRKEVELDLESCKYNLDKKVQEIVNNVEGWYNIYKTYIIIGGKKNHRYKLYSEYKASRKEREKPPFMKELREQLINIYDAKIAPLGEADDIIYEMYLKCNKRCVVASIDKDIHYWCSGIPLYNYRSYKDVLGEWKSYPTKKSRLAIATQILVGDSVDDVNFTKGYGPAFAKKILNEDMTNYQYIKAIYKAYIDIYKGDIHEAKKYMKLSYSLLKLYTQKEIKELSL